MLRWNRLLELLHAASRSKALASGGWGWWAAGSGGAEDPDWPPAVAPVAARVLTCQADRLRYTRSEAQAAASGARDYTFNLSPTDAAPDAAFDRLRWGGQMAFISPRPREVEALLADYRQRPEWLIEDEPTAIAPPATRSGMRGIGPLLPAPLRRRWLGQTTHYFVARKVLLDPAHRLTAKHSFDVRLIPDPDPGISPTPRTPAGPLNSDTSGGGGEISGGDSSGGGYVVLKRVPTLQQAMDRLAQTCPDVPAERLEAIAAKLVRKVFPIYLTREAAFLKLLQRDLPERFRGRTPKVLSHEVDDAGLVRSLTMRWMRQGGPPISQTQFARQAAELLWALHEDVGIMHLDLRLDNLLVTEAGVCLIDFGSSVRIGETFAPQSTIDTLIREMLASSQITRDLKRQRRKNLVRAAVFADLPYPPTPAFDLFALATSMTRPHDNADFKGLVIHDHNSDEGLRLSRLRKRILQPPADDPTPIRSVADLCVELGVETAQQDKSQRQPRSAMAG